MKLSYLWCRKYRGSTLVISKWTFFMVKLLPSAFQAMADAFSGD